MDVEMGFASLRALIEFKQLCDTNSNKQ